MKQAVPPGLRDEWLSRHEAASELRMHSDTVVKKVTSGVLDSMKYGKFTFISRASVQRYLNQFRHVARDASPAYRESPRPYQLDSDEDCRNLKDSLDIIIAELQKIRELIS